MAPPAPGPPPALQGTRLSIRRSMGISQGTHTHVADPAPGAVRVCVERNPSVTAAPDVGRPPRSASLIRPSRKRPGEPHLHTGPVASQDGRCRHFLGDGSGDDSSRRRAAPGAWEYWRAQIEAHRGGGLSQMACCARHGLRKGTFSFCKLRRDIGTGAGRRGAIGMRSGRLPSCRSRSRRRRSWAPRRWRRRWMTRSSSRRGATGARVCGGAWIPRGSSRRFTDSRRRRAPIGSSLARRTVSRRCRAASCVLPAGPFAVHLRLTAAVLAHSIPLTAGRARSARPEANVRCACGSSGAAVCGAGGVMARERGRGEGRGGRWCRLRATGYGSTCRSGRACPRRKARRWQPTWRAGMHWRRASRGDAGLGVLT